MAECKGIEPSGFHRALASNQVTNHSVLHSIDVISDHSECSKLTQCVLQHDDVMGMSLQTYFPIGRFRGWPDNMEEGHRIELSSVTSASAFKAECAPSTRPSMMWRSAPGSNRQVSRPGLAFETSCPPLGAALQRWSACPDSNRELDFRRVL